MFESRRHSFATAKLYPFLKTKKMKYLFKQKLFCSHSKETGGYEMINQYGFMITDTFFHV